MKKYKNIYLSGISYFLTLAVVYLIPGLIWSIMPDFASKPSFLGHLLLILGIVLLIAGFFFAFRSIHVKESRWAGHLMIIIGVLILVSPLISFIIGYHI